MAHLVAFWVWLQSLIIKFFLGFNFLPIYDRVKMKIALFLVAYAFLILIGGIIGYFKAGSGASFWAAFAFFIPYLICAIALYHYKLFGGIGCTFLTLALCGFFLYRFVLTHAFFPVGLMLIASFISLCLCYFALIKLKRY
jgi:uncharacterized membrane protein (UPF0136 family)